MTTPPSMVCPRCGASANGAYCSQCGAPLGDQPCLSCGAILSPAMAFCPGCGIAARAAPLRIAGPVRRRAPVTWLVVGVLTATAIAAVAYATRGRERPSALAAPTSAGAPPDLSQLTLKEQFERLNDRVARAAEQGDSATVINFWPMAATAYANLPPADRDVDARFHMAWLHILVGDFPPALALADTIMTASPNNLFGYFVRATIAVAQGDSAAAQSARAAFRTHFGTEIGKPGHPEYVDHRAMLDQFLKVP